jgi:preprotein translocase subunit YajC
VFFNVAYADASASNVSAQAPQALMANVLPIVFVCVIFYLLVIRPHQTKLKQHKKVLDSLVIGDKVLTNGGIVGTIYSTPNARDELMLEIAKGVRVTIMKSSIASLVEKSTDVVEGKATEV